MRSEILKNIGAYKLTFMGLYGFFSSFTCFLSNDAQRNAFQELSVFWIIVLRDIFRNDIIKSQNGKVLI